MCKNDIHSDAQVRFLIFCWILKTHKLIKVEIKALSSAQQIWIKNQYVVLFLQYNTYLWQFWREFPNITCKVGMAGKQFRYLVIGFLFLKKILEMLLPLEYAFCISNLTELVLCHLFLISTTTCKIKKFLNISYHVQMECPDGRTFIFSIGCS